MSDLKGALAEALASAFADEGLDASFGRVTVSDRPDLADFQCNGALAAAKAAKANPRDIASRVAMRLRGDPRLASVEIAGPGFINLRVADPVLAERANAIAGDERCGAAPVAAPRRVIIDYAGPNVAKEMHVGHLRSSIIGESLKRLYRFRGDTVLGDAHFGDWGLQMGLLIIASLDEQPQLAEVLAAAEAAPGEASEARLRAALAQRILLADLDRLYPTASARNKSDPAYRDRARKATAELQAGRWGYRVMWRYFAEITRVAL